MKRSLLANQYHKGRLPKYFTSSGRLVSTFPLYYSSGLLVYDNITWPYPVGVLLYLIIYTFLSKYLSSSIMLCHRLSELAQIISLNTKTVENYYLNNSLPIPSIDVNGPSEAFIRDENAAAARCTVLGAIHELKCLMLGPRAALMAVEVRLSMLTL